MDFIVGTFNYAALYSLRFTPPTSTAAASLSLIRESPAIAGHSWLSLSRPGKDNERFLYATAWTQKPSIAAYAVKHPNYELEFINAKHVRAVPGYVCCSETHVYSVGGQTGEVFAIAPDGGIGELVQELSFLGEESSERPQDTHGAFGGLRHGAHSVDLSPDGKSLYVADIGRNCIWTYSVNLTGSRPDCAQSDLDSQIWSKEGSGLLHLNPGSKHVSPRSNDGPRHTWPHPNGKVLYSVQEHSSMVDVFSVGVDGVTLEHKQGVKIIPAERDAKEYWADEVRLSSPRPASGEAPKYLYASTRGLRAETKGYVAVFAIEQDGSLCQDAIHIWETPTSGGLANAIEPAPWRHEHCGTEYLALTDSEEGWVFVLSFNGKEIQELARLSLGKTEDGKIIGSATAVWL